MKRLSTLFAVPFIVSAAGLALPTPAAGQPETGKPAAKTPPSSAPDAATPVGDPYPLPTCPISGGKLGSMGEPIVKAYDGREVRFCCASCPPKFEKDKAASFAKLDGMIVKDQLPLYPLDTSVVSGKKLPEKTVDWVYGNRLVRLADEAEKGEFLKDPEKNLAVLDKVVIAKQGKDYPLTTCPASGGKLGGMGEPMDLVIAGRLIRLCCESCENDVRKNAVKVLAMVDEARKGAVKGNPK